MKKVRYMYFDTEFTGLTKNTDLISIGIVCETGESFYAEITDFDKSKIEGNQWIHDNVINNLYQPDDMMDGDHIAITGTKEMISKLLNVWLIHIHIVNDYTLQFISDVSHYDFVLLIDLLTNGGTAFDLPDFISPACYDINQLITMRYVLNNDEDTSIYINDIPENLKDAFDKNREEIATEELISTYVPENIRNKKHNALFDAYIIKLIFENSDTVYTRI